ncbi:hypothetical protein BDF20DRAFT_798222, partial [Mycotypha africana]|uniref:uncharacterized protein n=1 Tax=Mycotypha africana TaxID=64632 RepID=UPI0023017B3D
LDAYEKKIFDLKLSIYYFQEKLRKMDPTNLEKLTKENKKLSEQNELFANELRKYKGLIIDMDEALENLQEKVSNQSRGMTRDEQQQFDMYKSDAEYYRKENERLRDELEQLRQDNKHLRSTRSSTSQFEKNEELTECRKKLSRAQQLIDQLQRINQQQKQQIDGQRSCIEKRETDDARLNSVLSARDRAREELKRKNQLINNLEDRLGKLQEDLDDAEHELADKSKKCDEYLQQLRDLRLENTKGLDGLEKVEQLQKENQELSTALASREQEVAALEKEIEKLLVYIEKVKDGQEDTDGAEVMAATHALQEKEQELKVLQERLDLLNNSQHEELEDYEKQLVVLETELQKKDQQCKEVEIQLRKARQTIQNQRKEFEEALESQYNKLIIAVRDKEVSIAELENDMEAKQDILQREKQLLKEELQNMYVKL